MKPKPSELQKMFDWAHENGSREFGVLWLYANDLAIASAEKCGVTSSNDPIKTILSLTVLHVLREAKR